MANNNSDNNARQPKTKKLLLAKLFTDASVRQEPEEPQKVLVAGLAEARPVKQYPDTFFGRAFKVFRGEYGTLIKSTLCFILFTVPFAVILFWFAGYFSNTMLSGTYNFMGGIGVGYPFGGGDSISESVARLYWEVKEPTYLMLAASLILIFIGWSGLFYCAKRSYYQDYYKRVVRTYFMGFAKTWWKFLLFGGAATLIGSAMVTALMHLLARQQLFAANAGDYCGVIFSWIIGAPLILLCLITLALSATYDLKLGAAIKNSLVLFVNNPFSSIFTCVLSVAPLLLLLAGTFFSVIVYALMVFIGFALIPLCFIALVGRGMTKCHDLKELSEKQAQLAERRANRGAYQGANGGAAAKKQKQPANRYQNPKKKKKKK